MPVVAGWQSIGRFLTGAHAIVCSFVNKTELLLGMKRGDENETAQHHPENVPDVDWELDIPEEAMVDAPVAPRYTDLGGDEGHQAACLGGAVIPLPAYPWDGGHARYRSEYSGYVDALQVLQGMSKADGHKRRHWAQELLEEADRERMAYEEWVRDAEAGRMTALDIKVVEGVRQEHLRKLEAAALRKGPHDQKCSGGCSSTHSGAVSPRAIADMTAGQRKLARLVAGQAATPTAARPSSARERNEQRAASGELQHPDQLTQIRRRFQVVGAVFGRRLSFLRPPRHPVIMRDTCQRSLQCTTRLTARTVLGELRGGRAGLGCTLRLVRPRQLRRVGLRGVPKGRPKGRQGDRRSGAEGFDAVSRAKTFKVTTNSQPKVKWLFIRNSKRRLRSQGAGRRAADAL